MEQWQFNLRNIERANIGSILRGGMWLLPYYLEQKRFARPNQERP